MKTLFCATIMLLYSFSANAFTVRTTDYGELVKWDTDRLDVYLSPTLTMIGPEEEVYFAVVDAFETWLYEAEIEMEINFIYGDCEPGYVSGKDNTNCIFAATAASSSNEDAGGNTAITYSQTTGNIHDGDVIFYKEAGNWKFEDEEEGLDFRHVALHEIGHFLGLTHSTVNKAIMYPTVNLHTRKTGSLHEDDIYGALALYDASELADHTNCQVTPASSTSSLGLIALLLALW